MFKEFKTFPNAPIVEAVLDIQVDLPDGTTLDQVSSFHDHVKERFPEKEDRTNAGAVIKLSSQGAFVETDSAKPIGYLYRSKETMKIVQARLDGFAFNKLKPYESWDAFRTEARELWNVYRKVVKPVKIRRIALRYINRIELPLPFDNFKEYILTVPEIAPTLPQGLAHYLMRLVIPNPEIGATAVIHEVMEQPTGTQQLPIIFDIDVYKMVTYTEENDIIWNEYEQLRIFKNDIFFDSITDKTQELFK